MREWTSHSFKANGRDKNEPWRHTHNTGLASTLFLFNKYYHAQVDKKLDFPEQTDRVCGKVNSGIFRCEDFLALVVDSRFVLFIVVVFILFCPTVSFYMRGFYVFKSSDYLRGLLKLYLILQFLRPLGLFS